MSTISRGCVFFALSATLIFSAVANSDAKEPKPKKNDGGYYDSLAAPVSQPEVKKQAGDGYYAGIPAVPSTSPSENMSPPAVAEGSVASGRLPLNQSECSNYDLMPIM